MTNTSRPTLQVESDYDGYFARLVSRWLDMKAESGEVFKHDTIVITAGPWRMAAVSANKRDNATLHLDFYSALRTGFGNLSSSDVAGILELL